MCVPCKLEPVLIRLDYDKNAKNLLPTQLLGVVAAILIGFLRIFVSTCYPIPHKIIQKCPFMQTALALQNCAKTFFPRLYPVSRN